MCTLQTTFQYLTGERSLFYACSVLVKAYTIESKAKVSDYNK